MSSRPYVLLSVAASLDGYIDDTSDTRLVLSNAEDLDRVDEVRASVDAILVGANTIRTDDPRLLVRSPERRQRRVDAGKPPNPIKVTLTGGGELDPDARFWTTGESEKIVYSAASSSIEAKLGGAATVVDIGNPLDLPAVLADLAGREVRRLLVEGGAAVHTMFLTAGFVDEIHLVLAPFFVGADGAPRLANPGIFPQSPERPMALAEIRQLGDRVLLRYLPGGTDV